MELRLMSAAAQNLQSELADSHGIALSLITNPSTSISTLSSLLNSLILNLQNSTYHPRRIISLLYALSRHHSNDLRREIFPVLRRFAVLPPTPVSSITHSLSILFSTDDPSNDVADESLFLSLCFRPLRPSQRHWLLRNASRFTLRPSVLITVMLGFTKDPYPSTRKAALDVLVCLAKFVEATEDQSLVEGCYFRATELLFDADEFVRCSAVRVVSEWGPLLVKANQDKWKLEWSDTLFVQLCSMVRDMSMKVRLEAFTALARVEIVSEGILLQTLSKKVSSATKEKSYPGRYTDKLFRLPASNVAFAFVHGLEDEFPEVRRSACIALRNLATLSADFAHEAVTLLMDMLNDDSVDLRLQALDTMLQMVMSDLLKVQEGHLHMLLGTLVDSSPLIRSAVRKVLELVKLHRFSMFKSCFEGLVRNMEEYPQDEADLLFVFLCIGQNHGKFVVLLIEKTVEEIEPSFGGTLRFESVRTVALLVLAISAPVSVEQSICSVPPRIFSYASTLLGRVCHSLAGHLNQNDLLSRLFQCSQFSFQSDFDFSRGGPIFPLLRRDVFFSEKTNGVSGSYFPKYFEPQHIYDETANCLSNIIEKVHDVWPLVHSGFIDEATRILRGWKKELKALTRDSTEPTAETVFVLQYLDVIELLGRVWMHRMFPLRSCSRGLGILEVLLAQLETNLNEMRYKFIGLTNEQEVHILEILLVAYTLQVCSLKACLRSYLEELSSIVAQMEHLVAGSGSAKVSGYVLELQKALGKIGRAGHDGSASCIISRHYDLDHSMDSALDNLYLLQKSTEHYSLRQFMMFTRTLFHVKVDLDLHNDFENPLHYISGLPVGIPCKITLCNISSNSRVWLKMTLHEKLSEYLELNGLSSGCDDERRESTVVAPFYRTPKISCFTLKVCAALELPSKGVSRSKTFKGPTGKLIKLSEEKVVYLSRRVK
ncbi:OLC1v1033595C1 [Oldenlandia corymbosa var. corymbosa]|uniref:OLC1v1033595C1 n=1 Tax=Oldenlandia corymbosa var. corymbosa TaxID=529605 RepID=A0AAV1CPD0_OLDCO|nr:OLC1v1033595C1 [Oldenlandia corymbosa var. corymbosa]